MRPRQLAGVYRADADRFSRLAWFPVIEQHSGYTGIGNVSVFPSKEQQEDGTRMSCALLYDARKRMVRYGSVLPVAPAITYWLAGKPMAS